MAMKRWNVISGVASTLFVASILTFGLSTEIASAHGQECKGHHKGDANCQPDSGGGGVLRVDVTFRDDVADRNPKPTDGLQSVGGTYVHKEQNVSAGIGGSGEFTLKLTKGNQLAMRMLFLDFTDCVSTDEMCNPPFQSSEMGNSVGLLTIATTGVDLLALTTENPSSDELNLTLLLDLNLIGGGSWVFVFNNDGFGICPEGNGINTDIHVELMSADKWVIEAKSTDVACLLKNDQGAMDLIFSGLYSMPFKMEVVKQ